MDMRHMRWLQPMRGLKRFFIILPMRKDSMWANYNNLFICLIQKSNSMLKKGSRKLFNSRIRGFNNQCSKAIMSAAVNATARAVPCHKDLLSQRSDASSFGGCGASLLYNLPRTHFVSHFRCRVDDYRRQFLPGDVVRGLKKPCFIAPHNAQTLGQAYIVPVGCGK